MRNRFAKPDRVLSDDLLGQAAEWVTGPESDWAEEGDWTFAKLKTAARVANSRVRLSPDLLRDDPKRLAESAIGYAIAVDPTVSWSDAVAAGQREIWDTASAFLENAGFSSRGQKPSFRAYWWDELLDYQRLPHVTQCELRMTINAVLRDLPTRHLDTLLILAFTDSMDEAAAAAGVKVRTWRQRVRVARECALTLWFDTEAPPSLTRWPINRRGRDRVCPQGHEISGDNVEVERRGGRIVERCKTCRSAQRAAYKERSAA